MKINFRSIVDAHKLPTSSPLLPLFEAIINSIQSIEEAKISNGQIDIKVIRELSLIPKNSWETDIDSFEVIDNGVGFTDKNYASFDIYGSDYKLAFGCKGVGRVLWLKAFSTILIESTYLADDGKYYDRNFNFSILEETKLIGNPISSKTQTGTRVVLDGYIQKYKNKCPKRIDTLAREIMNHCFAYLALDNCPRITISDEQDSRCINTIFNESTKGKLSVKEFQVNGNSFSIISAKNYAATNDKHSLHFCAHKREVFGDNLSNIIKELSGKLFNDDGEFIYSGYITGKLLDENINSERTEFAFAKREQSDPDESESDEQLEMEDTRSTNSVSKKEIVDAAVPIIREFLGDEIAAYNIQRKDRIEHYVYSQNPRYRSLLKHNSECMDKIPLTSDDQRLELELFKQEQTYRLQLKKEQKEYLDENVDNIQNYSDYESRCSNYLQKVSDLGKGDLADYITHRKVMLDILANNLKFTDEEKKKYALEKSIHNLIFPMITTSDDIDYNKHNLWIIDEKLAYHYYLASDKPISTYKDIESDCPKEPDIAIFEPAFALTGDSKDADINNITIIEFKRPGRSDEDCVDQVVGYIKRIRDGRCKDKDGRVLGEMNGKFIRFSCYILCDITVKMSEFLEGRNFRKTPDGNSYYQYYDGYNAYIEVLPYSKMINDSKRRNKILFDRLFCQ